MKEYQPKTLGQLQQAFMKAEQADGRLREMVASPMTVISSPNLRQLELNLGNLPGEDRIDLALTIGRRRKEIVEQIQQKTQPSLTELREKLEERIRAKRVEDLENKLSQLRQLVEEGFQYERELKEGEILLASLRGAPAEVEPAPVEQQLEKEEEVRPTLVFVEGAGYIEFDGQDIKLSPAGLKVLRVLAQNLDQQVLSRKLSEQALNEVDTTKSGLRMIIKRFKGKINQGGREFLVSSGRKGSSSGYMLRKVEVVWPKELAVFPEETPSVVEAKEKDVSVTLQELGVPPKGFYVIEDLAGVVVVGTSDLAVLRPRVSGALRKDPTIKSERFEGRRLYFRPDDFLKLIEAVRGPKRARGSVGERRTAVESAAPPIALPLTVEKPSSVEEEKKSRVTESPSVLAELKVNLTRLILPHFRTNTWTMLTQIPAEVIRNSLPSGVELSQVVNDESSEDISNLLAAAFIETVERLWEKSSGSSTKETKIINECQTIKQRRIDVSVVIRRFCGHFHLPIPERYRNNQVGEEEVERRSTTRSTQWDRRATFAGDGQTDVADPRFAKWNRRRPHGRKYPQDGRGLKTVILPILAKRAAGANSNGNEELGIVGRNGGQKEPPPIRLNLKLEEEIGEITDSELQAVSLFLSDSNVPIEEILKIAEASGLSLKRREAYRLLGSTVELTYRRKMGSWATAKEIQFWRRIKKFVEEEDDNLALRSFRSRLKEWYRQQRELRKLELEEIPPIEESQAEVLVEEETRKGLGFFRRFFSKR